MTRFQSQVMNLDGRLGQAAISRFMPSSCSPTVAPFLVMAILMAAASAGVAEVLDKQKALDAQTFWDNRDWDWYKSNIPFFECPDAEIVTTYYYRWELITRHLTYGSPNSGY